MRLVTIDLGTTNTKVCAYSEALGVLCERSLPVQYDRSGSFVEFDVQSYYDDIEKAIGEVCRGTTETVQIILTGQAESLVILGADGTPLRKAISWLDMRSETECEELKSLLGDCYKVTGQPEIIPTWPLTKILWIRKHEPETFRNAGKFLLLKDYIIYCLTGNFCGEHSIYPFSCYFDVANTCYWDQALEAVGIHQGQLPVLVEPCSNVGDVREDIRNRLKLAPGSFVNAGTLDHFAGMIGTGNVREGLISESAGTVSSIATLIQDPFSSKERFPFYCGPFPGSYIYLPVCESGGISLEWYVKTLIRDISFQEINQHCADRTPDKYLTFLPYLTGVNPPEFDSNAKACFYGLTAAHDRYDMALAVMYGVSGLLRKNIDCFRQAGIPTERMISTGGGAKSALWSQIKADVCNIPVVIPENSEAPSQGAAVIGAVYAGLYPDYRAATAVCVREKQVFYPSANRELPEFKQSLFCALYDALRPVFKIR